MTEGDIINPSDVPVPVPAATLGARLDAPADQPQSLFRGAVDDFVDDLVVQAEHLGEGVKDDIAAIRTEAAARLEVLRQAIAAREPGFDRTLRAARNNLAMFIASRVVARADDLDRRFLVFIEGGLRMGARLLAAV